MYSVVLIAGDVSIARAAKRLYCIAVMVLVYVSLCSECISRISTLVAVL